MRALVLFGGFDLGLGDAEGFAVIDVELELVHDMRYNFRCLRRWLDLGLISGRK